MKKLFFTSLLIIVATFFTMAQVSVKPASESTATSGVFYALPQTVIHVEVEVLRQDFVPGPLQQYATEFLGQRADASPYSSCTILDTKITSSTEPDPEQFYFAEFNLEERKKEHSMLLSFDNSGMISGVNIRNDEDNKVKSNKSIQYQLSNKNVDLFDYQLVAEVKEIVDTTIRQVSVDTAVIDEFILNKKLVRLSDKEKAEEIARLMNQINKDRYALSTGYQEVNYDAGALKYMDLRLKEQYEEYKALFMGKNITYTETYYFDYVPNKDNKNAKDILSYFSERMGISKSGDPIYIELKTHNTTEKIASYIKKLASSREEKGFYYRIPEMATVEVVYKNKVLHHLRMPINQFGVETYVPSSKNLGADINPKSGYLKQIILKP